MAGAGAGAGAGDYTVHPFFANGHGEQCILRTKKGIAQDVVVPYVLPPGVHFVTIDQAGEYALLASTEPLYNFWRDTFWTKLVPKPTMSKADDPKAWCKSPYMEFKHELAKRFNVVHAAYQKAGSELDALEAYAEPIIGRFGAPIQKTFAELQTGDPRLFDQLCDLYDQNIHIRYPGETIADNLFTPVSYVLKDVKSETGESTQVITKYDGACGLIDGKKIKPGVLTRELLQSELEADASRLPPLYRASVYPTESDVEEIIKKTKNNGPAAVDVLDYNYKRPVSKLIEMLVETYEVSESNPIVVYYPMCRVFPTPAGKTERRLFRSRQELARTASLTAETTGRPAGAGAGAAPPAPSPGGRTIGRQGVMSRSRPPPYLPGTTLPRRKGGRRRTYRKKKLRTQTRKRRQ